MNKQQLAERLAEIAEIDARSMMREELRALASELGAESFVHVGASGEKLTMRKFSDDTMILQLEGVTSVLLSPVEQERIANWIQRVRHE